MFVWFRCFYRCLLNWVGVHVKLCQCWALTVICCQCLGVRNRRPVRLFPPWLSWLFISLCMSKKQHTKTKQKMKKFQDRFPSSFTGFVYYCYFLIECIFCIRQKHTTCLPWHINHVMHASKSNKFNSVQDCICLLGKSPSCLTEVFLICIKLNWTGLWACAFWVISVSLLDEVCRIDCAD